MSCSAHAPIALGELALGGARARAASSRSIWRITSAAWARPRPSTRAVTASMSSSVQPGVEERARRARRTPCRPRTQHAASGSRTSGTAVGAAQVEVESSRANSGAARRSRGRVWLAPAAERAAGRPRKSSVALAGSRSSSSRCRLVVQAAEQLLPRLAAALGPSSSPRRRSLGFPVGRRGAEPTRRAAGRRPPAVRRITNVIVLGIDPGLANTGFGVVQRRGGRLAALDGGVIDDPRRAGRPSGGWRRSTRASATCSTSTRRDAVALEDSTSARTRAARSPSARPAAS